MVWTVLLTVASGAAVYVLCEIIKDNFLDPIREYRDLKGKIAQALILYRNELSGRVADDATRKNASVEIRKLAADVGAFAQKTSYRFKLGMPKRSTMNLVMHILDSVSNKLWNPVEKLTDYDFDHAKQMMVQHLDLGWDLFS